MQSNISLPSEQYSKHIRAAEYVRMSTDRQQFSIAYQQAAIRLYSAQHGITITRTYADEGRSGLTLEERPAMIQLLTDVECRCAEFDVILVYDVSRWGRFQDPDEGAYYEFRCRRAGKSVEYCAEQFSPEISPLNTVIKAIKRAMAAEYSRELSVRTYSAQARAAAQGFFAGGLPGYGLRRMLVDSNGKPKGLLPPGACKGLRTDRVVLIPGPQSEIDAVRRVFDLYVNKYMYKKQIVRTLNAEGIPFTDGRPWSEDHIDFILRNKRYIGTITFGKTSSLLRLGKGKGKIKTPAASIIYAAAGYEPIIPLEIFAAANAPKTKKGMMYRDEGLLDALKKLKAKHGYLSHRLIETTKGMPGPLTYRMRFGSLRAAYARIGTNVQSDALRLAHFAHTKRLLLRLVTAFEIEVAKKGLQGDWDWLRRTMKVSGGITVRFTIARYIPSRHARKPRWIIEGRTAPTWDFVMAMRMDPAHEKVLDYYFTPSHVLAKRYNFIDERNPLDPHRFRNMRVAVARAIKIVLASSEKSAG